MKTLTVSKKELENFVFGVNDCNSASGIIRGENIVFEWDMSIGNLSQYDHKVDVKAFCVGYSDFNFSEYTDEAKWIHIDTYNSNCEEGEELEGTNYVKYDNDTEKYILISEEDEDDLYNIALDNWKSFTSDFVNELDFSEVGNGYSNDKYKIIYID